MKKRAQRIWDDNIKMDHREVGWKDVDKIHAVQDKEKRLGLVNITIKFRVA
jgi:hypothetical protein